MQEMNNKIITVESSATFKIHTFEILKEDTYKDADEKFYLVKDLKAKKHKYQIISLRHRNTVFHSFGRVKTEKEANEWFEKYAKRYA